MRVRLAALVMAVSMLAATSSGCAFRIGDLSLIASQNVGFEPDVIQRSVEGKNCVYSFLIFPIGGFVPNLEEAMDEALAKVPEGNVLSNVAIYNDVLSLLIWGQSCLRVKGDVGNLE